MPRTCCSCYDDEGGYHPSSGDTCMFGGSYLNGWGPVVSVQLLALSGLFFSIATLGDCSFMELDERLFFPEDMDTDIPLKVTQTQFVGFLTWKQLDGSCYWYTSGEEWKDQLELFHDKLGNDWGVPRLVAMITCCLSFVYFLYLLSFTCSSQVRGVRYFNSVFLSIVLTGLQGVTFVAFDSSFCDDFGCTFSRSAAFSVAAMACYVVAGIMFLCMNDYPGPSWKKHAPTLIPPRRVAPLETQMRSETMQRESLQRSGIEEVMPDFDEEDFEEVSEDEGDEEANNNASSQQVFNVLEGGSRSTDDSMDVDSTESQEIFNALESENEKNVEAGVDAEQPAGSSADDASEYEILEGSEAYTEVTDSEEGNPYPL